MAGGVTPDVPAMLGVPGMPRDESGSAIFREPWEARAFALAVRLHERGLFTWREWAKVLAGRIERAHADAWRQAAASTPHGQPIELDRERLERR